MNTRETALLIIDMQRDFVTAESPLCVAGAAATVPAIAALLECCRRNGDIAIFHVIREEIVPELRPLPGEMVIVKPRYSAFFHTRLDLCLRRLGVDSLLIAGTQYPNCIRATVTDALSLDYRVTVLSDCCSARTPEIAEANLTDMRNLGARCVTLAAWRAGADD